MKNQALFSSKYKSTKLKCHLLQFLFGALRVKFLFVMAQLKVYLLVFIVILHVQVSNKAQEKKWCSHIKCDHRRDLISLLSAGRRCVTYTLSSL